MSADLKLAARVAYERGRWRDAALAASPAILLGVLAGTTPVHLLATVLLFVGVWVLAHRGGAAGAGAPVGLAAGAIPLVLVLVSRSSVCGVGDCATWCLAACAVGGIAGGWVVGRIAARRVDDPVLAGLSAAIVGVIVAAMGCWCVGATGVGAVAVAMVATSPIAWRTQIA